MLTSATSGEFATEMLNFSCCIVRLRRGGVPFLRMADLACEQFLLQLIIHLDIRKIVSHNMATTFIKSCRRTDVPSVSS
jgi:hypothetical protein